LIQSRLITKATLEMLTLTVWFVQRQITLHFNLKLLLMKRKATVEQDAMLPASWMQMPEKEGLIQKRPWKNILWIAAFALIVTSGDLYPSHWQWHWVKSQTFPIGAKVQWTRQVLRLIPAAAEALSAVRPLFTQELRCHNILPGAINPAFTIGSDCMGESSVPSPRGGYGGLSPPKQSSKPTQIERWNIIDMWGFG